MSELENVLFDITTRQDLSRFVLQLANRIRPGMVFYLHGPLGSGKTTLVQELARALGCRELLSSPTYSLLEEYKLSEYSIIHMDLYRLKDKNELDMLGLRDYMQIDALWLIEWPDRVGGGLPKATVNFFLKFEQTGGKRSIEVSETECNIIGLKAC